MSPQLEWLRASFAHSRGHGGRLLHCPVESAHWFQALLAGLAGNVAARVGGTEQARCDRTMKDSSVVIDQLAQSD